MTTEKLEIIDFSSYLILKDPEAVAKAGVKIAYVRQGYGRYWSDAAYPYFHRELTKVGVDVPPYIMFQPMQDVTLQVDYALASWRDHKAPIAVDVELRHKIGRSKAGGALFSFCMKIERETYRKPLIYTAPYIFNQYYYNTTLPWSRFPLWVADPDPQTKPDLPFAWSVWALWQYTWKASIPGLIGRVDVNRQFGSFNFFQTLGAATLKDLSGDGLTDPTIPGSISRSNGETSGNI